MGFLLRDIMGESFDRMAPAVRRLHSIDKAVQVRGVSRVMGGKNPLAWFIRIMAQLPRPVWRTPITIDFIRQANGEEWDRRFGSSRFHTIMTQEGKHLAERMAAVPIAFTYDVRPTRTGFSLHTVSVRVFGLPLPRFLWPSLAARGSEWRGRYRFSTRVGFWFCGRVISYFGYLDAPEA